MAFAVRIKHNYKLISEKSLVGLAVPNMTQTQ